MILVLLNGPPRCGKDFAGRLLAKRQGVAVDKFARILKERCHAAYGKPELPHDYFEAVKDEPCDLFLGRTPREVYIAFSEAFMKPLHGKNVFGRMLAAEWAGHSVPCLVITDSGFREEAEALIEGLGSAATTTLIRIHRQGRTFAGDSRSYLDLGVREADVVNPGEPEGFRRVLAKALPEMFQ
jgi:hypothetical protein